MTSLITLLALQTRAHAACPDPVDLDRFTAQLALAEQRFAAMDGAVFAAAMDEASFLVPCVQDVVGPDLASHYHQLQGLRLFVSRTEERAMQAFAAARAADPRAELPLALVPEGHAIRDLWATADPSGPTLPVPRPVSGVLLFDGVPGDRRPATRPTLVQLVSATDEVEATAWLEPGDPLPSYGALPLPSVAADRAPRSLRTPLLVGGGAAAILGGVLYGVAASRAGALAELRPPEATLDDLRSARRSTNALVVASGVAGGVSVVTVGAGILVGRW